MGLSRPQLLVVSSMVHPDCHNDKENIHLDDNNKHGGQIKIIPINEALTLYLQRNSEYIFINMVVNIYLG